MRVEGTHEAESDGEHEEEKGKYRALYALYFLNACLTAFPDTAYGSWLNKELQLPQDVIARYYAFGFMPWFFKPLYCWIAENFSICGGNRRSYVALCSVVSALCYVYTALFCRTVVTAFGLVFLRSVVEAFSELMLGLVLIDAVSAGVESAAEMQSRANGCRIAGSLFAFILGLPLYGCSSSNGIALPDRTIIGLNAAFPVLALLASSFLPRGIKNRSRDESKPRLLTEQSGFYGVFGNAYFGLVIILFILLWTSCKALVPNEAAWVGVETFSCCLLATWTFRKTAEILTLRRRERAAFDAYLMPLIVHSVIPGLFLFGINAVPSAESTWSSLQYFLFDSKANCKIQVMSAATTGVGLLACLFYSKWLAGRSIRRVLAYSIIVSALSSLLKLPVVEQKTLPSLQVWGIDTFSFVLLVSMLDAFAKTTLFLALQVLATESCAHVQRSLFPAGGYSAGDADGNFLDEPGFAEKYWPHWLSPGMMYGFFLSCIDFADTISGWISAPIISAFGISFYPTLQMDGFTQLVLLAIGAKMVFIFFLPLIPS